MGGKQGHPPQFSSSASLKVDFQESQVTSEGSLFLVREVDQR